MTFTKRMAVAACIFVGLTGQGFANPKNDFYELDLGREKTVEAQPLRELPGFEGADNRFLVQESGLLGGRFKVFEIVSMPASSDKKRSNYLPPLKEPLTNVVLTRAPNGDFLQTEGDHENKWVVRGLSCHFLLGPDYLVKWGDPKSEQGQMANAWNANSLEGLVLLSERAPAMSENQIAMLKAYVDQHEFLKASLKNGGDYWEANGSQPPDEKGNVPYGSAKIPNIHQLRDTLGLSPLKLESSPNN